MRKTNLKALGCKSFDNLRSFLLALRLSLEGTKEGGGCL